MYCHVAHRRSTDMGGSGNIEFFQTLMGRRYYESTMPEIAKQLKRIADALERLVELQGDQQRTIVGDD
jgi:hypothetical protein